MGDLFTRLFLNWRTSLDGGVLTVIAWLSSNGITLSDGLTTKAAAVGALLSAAAWKLFSTDPEPPRAAS
jgi:hypothetical protein